MKSITIAFSVLMINLATIAVCDDFSDSELACLKNKLVTEAELNAFFKGGMKPADAKDNIKCFIKCVMEDEGYLKNGLILEDATVKGFQESPEMKNFPNLAKVITDCKVEKGVNDCDTAFKIMMCWAKNKVNLHD